MATFKRTGTIGTAEAGVHRRHGRPRLSQGFRRALLRPDRGVRRIRLSGKPRRLLRAARLCLLLVQDLLSRRVLRGDPQLAAHGFLCAGPARARCARPWRRNPRGRRQSFRLGLHAGKDALRPSAAFSTATPRCAASSGPNMPSASASARSKACRKTAWKYLSHSVATGYESVRDVWLRSGLDVDEIEKLAQADAFRSHRPRPPCRALAGPCARPQEPPPKPCRCSIGPASGYRTTSRQRTCPSCRRRARHPRLPLARPVAQGAPRRLPSRAAG